MATAYQECNRRWPGHSTDLTVIVFSADTSWREPFSYVLPGLGLRPSVCGRISGVLLLARGDGPAAEQERLLSRVTLRAVCRRRSGRRHRPDCRKSATTLPVGAFFCILHGATRGRRCSPASIRAQLHRTAAAADVRRRFAPHQLRHAHAVEMSREGAPLVVIQRQLGHADLGVTSAYLRGIDNTEIIHTVHERPTPMIPATARLTPST
jgi:hypothetical protein